MRKVSNRVAATVLLALAASTAVRLRWWRDAADATFPWDREHASSESRRMLKLMDVDLPGHHKSNSYYDQLWRSLQTAGYDPQSEEFETIVRNRVSNQEDLLVGELRRYHRSQSALDRAWRGLLRDGMRPGSPPFERLLESRGYRRELGRGNEMLATLGEDALNAKVFLEDAKSDYSKAVKKLEEQKKRMAVEEETPEPASEVSGANRQLRVKEETRRTRWDETRRKQRAKRKLLQKRRDWLQGDYGVGGVKAVMEAVAEIEESLAELGWSSQDSEYSQDSQPLSVCDRNADVGSPEDFASLQKYAQCPEITTERPILLLAGLKTHGRTGNNLIEFLHAIQEARDMDYQLGILYPSWATSVLLTMWMAIDSDDWETQFEQAFCVKIFYDEEELRDFTTVLRQDTKELFFYRTNLPLKDYVASQEYSIQTLFRNYNTGEGRDIWGSQVKDMCSGINAIFGEEERGKAMYSVIHSRTLEGEPGFRLLGTVARRSGCDPVAALEMKPDYIKAILEPLGMMKYPIVFITDDENPEVLERLLADPEIGPMIRTVPEEACWIGGDLTLGIMSNVFIGNPASTFTGFIAKSRLALGFGHNYLFRAKDVRGRWMDVCREDCIFDWKVMHVQA